jgi:hypothetical protein
VQPGVLPGFSDSYVPYPTIGNHVATVNWVVNSSTFVEANYGRIENQLAGGNENGILVNDSANRLNGLAAFPLLYPNAGTIPTGSYAYQVMQAEKPVFWDGTSINLPPVFGWGGRIGAAPPNQRYPGWLNINRTQDVSASLTKIAGHHTFKTGFYNNHSYKAQNVGAGGIANLSFQGYVNFANDTNNPLDTGFGYANAMTGVFSQYLQASNFTEGSMLYNNTEAYIQDNWKVNSRLTLDYGVRFTHQQPQYDQFQQMSNFFTDKFSPSAAPTLYVPGCSNGAATCTGGNLNAQDPRTGQFVIVPGSNSQALIGTPIPGSGDASTNGIIRAGDGISKYSYTWPAVVVGPRFGYAYDLTGTQKFVVRGGGGWFYDRPDGNTVFSIPGNPPISTSQNLLNGMLQNVGSGSGLSPQPVPALVVFQYDAKIPTSVQWNSEIQMALPWSTALTVAYVGNHGYNLMGSFQGGGTVNLNAVDFGTAYLPQYQNQTVAPSSVPGATALTTNLLRPYQGLSTINQQTPEFHDTYHSLQFTLQRRYRNNFAFGINYTRGLSYKGNTGLQLRLQHNPDGSYAVRDDQAQYEKLNENLDLRPNIIKANALYDLPKLHGSDAGAMKALGYVLNDWQVSGVLSAGSAPAYDLSYSYQSNGGNVNLTGSPDYGARIVYVGDPGSGCSDNQYAQFNVAAVTGPGYNSVGLESGRNILRGCMDKTVDMALAKNIRLPGQKNIQFRADIFNLFNTYVINARQTQVQFNNPTSMQVVNAEYNADGTINPSRLTPRTAGFGAATGAQNRGSEAGLGNNYNRVMMLQVRFQF